MNESTAVASDASIDPWDAQIVQDADGFLASLNAAGVLAAAEVHVARRVGQLGREPDEAVLVAVALAVRGVRLGASCINLPDAVADARAEAPEVEWPNDYDDLDAWVERIDASPLSTGVNRVIVVERPLLHVARYYDLEVSLGDRLSARLAADSGGSPVDEHTLQTELDRLFEGPTFAEQRAAAERALRSRTSVLVGGPGTGKTTTIARLLVTLRVMHSAAAADSGATHRPLNVGLAAPTGKAAARMREAISEAAEADVLADDERQWLRSLNAVTLHRLLGPRPDHRSMFRHHAGQKLPHDVVIVDESSMVSLLMMERLVQALPESCRLVLVGDGDQLASVEAGAVLRDIVEGLGGSESPHVASLRHGHRFAGAIGDLARAVVLGDGEKALEILESAADDIEFVAPESLDDVMAERPARQTHQIAQAAATGDVAAALHHLGEHRLLCAHRDGPFGVSTWNAHLEREVRHFADASQPWYVGRPIIVTRNDPALRVNNGDVGVATDVDGRLVAHLDTGIDVAAARLSAVQHAYASTVHRSQGSEFDHVTLLLPDEDSLILTRELLYTAITRARTSLTVIGTPEVVLHAIGRRTARASGVARRLQAAIAP